MKKTIRLTESILHQKIDQILSERVGVPNNITETATNIYNAILWYFPEKYDLSSKGKEYSITIKDEYTIGDYTFNKLQMEIKVYDANPGIYVPEIMGASVNSGDLDITGYKFHRAVTKSLIIEVRFAVGKLWYFANIIEVLKREKEQIISILSHELLHQYENHKQPDRSLSSAVKYNASQNYYIERVKPINDFMFMLYFVHEIESNTRPSEVYGSMKSLGVTKSNFKEFFNTYNVITLLRRCRDYKISDLVHELHNYMDEIDVFLSSLNQNQVHIPLHVNGTDNEKIHDVLKLTHMAIVNIQIEKYRNIMTQSLNNFLKVINPSAYNQQLAEKQKYFEVFLKKVKKEKNYIEFFENEIKRFNFVGDKTIKKLSKLYSMLDDNKSIVNWDLHNKINKTGEKTKLRLQELLKGDNIVPDKNLIPNKKK